MIAANPLKGLSRLCLIALIAGGAGFLAFGIDDRAIPGLLRWIESQTHVPGLSGAVLLCVALALLPPASLAAEWICTGFRE